MTDSDTQALTAPSWSRFSGVTFAAVAGPLVGLLVVVGLALAQVVIYAGAIVGIAVAASVTTPDRAPAGCQSSVHAA